MANALSSIWCIQVFNNQHLNYCYGQLNAPCLGKHFTFTLTLTLVQYRYNVGETYHKAHNDMDDKSEGKREASTN